MYSILHIDQYSRLAIRFDIFQFSANNSKTNMKFEKSFPLVCRELVKSNPLMYNIKDWGDRLSLFFFFFMIEPRNLKLGRRV